MEGQIRAQNMGMVLDNVRFECDFDKQIFMAVNVCRFAPKDFVAAVQRVKQNNARAKAVEGTHELIKFMQACPRLPYVRWDEAAAKACKQQSDKMAMEPEFAEIGHENLYNGIVGIPNAVEEFALKQFEG